ncbi:MAG: SIMPL domain-containing protein [Candidatus Zambryskibacteria bacterium]|nr:SIMPL domain-containing protein [Candidatus Zambryskibacteria bacterium]
MENFLDTNQKKKLFKSLLAVFILLSVFLGIESINAIKEFSYIGRGTIAANVISVTGKGEVVAIPDKGMFSFSAVEQAKTVEDAQSKASAKINAIIDALKKLSIEEKDIKTTGYNSYPKYDYVTDQICSGGYCRPSKQILIGYEVSQTISVKIRKTADAGLALSKVGELSASNISSLDFVIDNMEAVQAQARDKAIADAKAKAKVLAKSLGVNLSKIINFEEGNSQPPVYYANALGSKAVEVKSQVPQVPVGENTVTSNVTLTYEIQ